MRLLLIFVELFAVWNFLADPTNKDIQGEYVNEKDRIVIKNDTLLFIINQGTASIYASDTLAECSIIKKDENWYEINSLDSRRRKVHKSFTITQTKDRAIKDNVCFTVQTSSKYELLEAELFYSLPSRRICSDRFPIYNGEGHIYVARKDFESLLYLEIFPRYPMFEPESYSFTGIATDIFLIDDVDINKTNNVTFDITGIDDAYFQRYNVFHEYINVTDEVLLWRGKKYLRQ